MYTITEIWFDIAHAVFTIGQFASNSTLEHVVAIKQIFQYLLKYPNLGITFSQNKIFKLEKHIDFD